MIDEINEKLDKIRLYGIKEKLPILIDNFSQTDKGFLDILNVLLDTELINREQRCSQNNIHVAHFPFVKDLSTFDFDFQPSLDKNRIMNIAELGFITDKKNVIFYGDSGVGKTHLATAIGIEAAKKRYCVYFISCNDLINNLIEAHKENRAAERIKHYCKYKLLIIDEIGYLPTDKDGANLFFQLISKRYEKNSTIITTNQPFDKWPEVFGNSTIAHAIVDRLVHHSIIVNIKGKSYRIKELKDQMNIV